MKLTELDPNWVGSGGEGVTDKDGNPVPRREGVGVSFDCPTGCGFPIFIGFENPLDGGMPYRNDDRALWKRVGETFEELTLTPSIQRMDGCRWHGFITNGEAVNA